VTRIVALLSLFCTWAGASAAGGNGGAMNIVMAEDQFRVQQRQFERREDVVKLIGPAGPVR